MTLAEHHLNSQSIDVHILGHQLTSTVYILLFRTAVTAASTASASDVEEEDQVARFGQRYR